MNPSLMSVRDYGWLKKIIKKIKVRGEKKLKREIIYIYKSLTEIYVCVEATTRCRGWNESARPGPNYVIELLLFSRAFYISFRCRIKRRFALEMFPGETFISALWARATRTRLRVSTNRIWPGLNLNPVNRHSYTLSRGKCTIAFYTSCGVIINFICLK